jgi:hypothetical protein
MHVFDLGISQYFLGGLLEDMLEEVPGSNKAARMISLNQLLDATQKNLEVPAALRTPNLEPSQFQSAAAQYPVLKRVKARRTRQLVHTAVDMLQSLTIDSDYRGLRFEAALKLSEVTRIVEDCKDWHMDSAKARILLDSYTAFARMCTWLSKHHLREHNRFRYHFTIKFHVAFHLCEQVQYLSPRLTWNYGSESFVGNIASLAQASCAGTRPSILSHSLVRKYNVALGLLLADLF